MLPWKGAAARTYELCAFYWKFPIMLVLGTHCPAAKISLALCDRLALQDTYTYQSQVK